jgi:F-type H+-transporting ATPase subunit b
MFQLFLAAEEHAAAAAGEHAADHPVGHAGVLDIGNWLPGVTALIVFLTAFIILAVFVWPKITRALDEREQKIRSEIESAEKAREKANAALAEYERNLASAREEASKMINQAKADAKAVADELKSRNQAEMVEMKQRATREIESAKQAAISAIHNEAASLGVSIASKILQRQVNEGDQARMIDDSLQELAQAGRS